MMEERRMEDRRDNTRLALLEQRVDALRAEHDALKKCKLEHVEEDRHVQNEIFEQLADIKTTLNQQKSFVAGMVFTATGITGLAWSVLNYFKH